MKNEEYVNMRRWTVQLFIEPFSHSMIYDLWHANESEAIVPMARCVSICELNLFPSTRDESHINYLFSPNRERQRQRRWQQRSEKSVNKMHAVGINRAKRIPLWA